MEIKRLDHFVLTVGNIEKTVAFYTDVLGMEKQEFGQGRIALKFGNQKINLHEYGHEFEPKAAAPTPGSTDLCFLTDTPLSEIMERFKQSGIDVVLGPVNRTGATGPIESIYIRDPDGNLIELAHERHNRFDIRTFSEGEQAGPGLSSASENEEEL